MYLRVNILALHDYLPLVSVSQWDAMNNRLNFLLADVDFLVSHGAHY